MTFAELIDWYLKLKSVQKLASFKRVKGALGNFNQAFGERIVSSLKPLDLENYQDKREEEGGPRPPSTWKSASPRPWSPRLLTMTC